MSSTNTNITTSCIEEEEEGETYTYWCHECDMSVRLLSTNPPPPLLCPHCNGDFLEEMDSPLFTPPPPSNPNPNFSSLPPPLNPRPFPILSPPQTLTPADDDDDSFHIPSTLRLSDAYLLDRLIQHLTDPNDDDDDAPLHHHGSSPASKSSVESIPTVKITPSFLASDTILCAVCKDEFVIDIEAKQLPCNHIYHFDCILPWLSHHNSCPVCRFLLPTDESQSERESGRRPDAVPTLRFGNLMEEEEDDEDLFSVGSTLRHIVRRHRLVFPMRSTSLGSSSSPTQMAQAETSSAGPANSGETVSSFPVEGENRLLGGVGGSAGGRLDEDGDTVMSEVRQGSLD